MNKRVLYISYDGLLDPLGQSQIIPYIQNIAKNNSIYKVISFEKSNRFAEYDNDKRKIYNINDLSWKPLIFSERFGIFGKLIDLAKMFSVSIFYILSNNLDTVHARGHPSALTALIIKKVLLFKKIKFIFDFRGLWADERVEKGGWDLTKKIHFLQYKIFKNLEKLMLKNATSTVVLTNKLKRCLNKIAGTDLKKVYVIPCCADYDFFIPEDHSENKATRQSLNIPIESFVIGYVGSIGNMYNIDLFYKLIEIAQNEIENCYGLVMTNDINLANEKLKQTLSSNLQQKIINISVKRQDVPKYFNVMNVSTIFLNDSYSRLGTSPTKFAESLALGIPVICSENIGDLKEHVKLFEGGYIINISQDKALGELTKRLHKLKYVDAQKLREKSRKIYSLDSAVKIYNQLYSEL